MEKLHIHGLLLKVIRSYVSMINLCLLKCDILTSKGADRMNADWYYEIADWNEPIYRNLLKNYTPDFSIKTLDNHVSPIVKDFQSNPIVQWVITPFLNPREGQCFQIPIISEGLLKYIITHIAGYFESCKGIYEDNTLTMVRLSELKEEYREILMSSYSLNTHFIHPVISDFYLDHDFEVHPFGEINAINYEVDIEKFRKAATLESAHSMDDRLWKFHIRPHIESEGNIILSPEGWRLHDDLIHSPFLEYITGYANRVILTVNTLNNHLRAIEIR